VRKKVSKFINEYSVTNIDCARGTFIYQVNNNLASFDNYFRPTATVNTGSVGAANSCQSTYTGICAQTCTCKQNSAAESRSSEWSTIHTPKMPRTACILLLSHALCILIGFFTSTHYRSTMM
jgi:hypothetical protein